MNTLIPWVLIGVAMVLIILGVIYFHRGTRRDISFFLFAGANFLSMVANFLVGNTFIVMFNLVLVVWLLFLGWTLYKDRTHLV